MINLQKWEENIINNIIDEWMLIFEENDNDIESVVKYALNENIDKNHHMLTAGLEMALYQADRSDLADLILWMIQNDTK